jgi:hypothetical protein
LIPVRVRVVSDSNRQAIVDDSHFASPRACAAQPDTHTVMADRTKSLAALRAVLEPVTGSLRPSLVLIDG